MVRHEPGIEAKVAALRDRALYPDAPLRVDTVETHMSWVFLTEAHAWKLKKTRRFDHLDFRSAAARHFYCLEELRLNQRLAPGVYLDVVPLTLADDGAIAIDGRGRVIDWLVKMRRLPAAAALDAMMTARRASLADMRRIASRLASFYASQPPAPLGARAYRALLARHIDEYRAELLRPEWKLPANAIEALCTAQRDYVERAAALLDERLAAGHVVEGHGDLRPEHVWLGEPVAIIDALEFSSELRIIDAADELGFLALECERAGSEELGDELLLAYREFSGDRAPRSLVHFYQSCRAASRARLAIRHLAEPRYRASPVWRERTDTYLELGERHMAACAIPPAAA